MTVIRASTGLLFVLGLAGCASALRDADRAFDSGDYARAAVAYEAALAARPQAHLDERALFRLAVTHAMPDSPVYDPAKAETLLVDLSRLHPDGPYAERTRVILPFVRQARKMEDEVAEGAARITTLQGQIDALTGRVQGLQADLKDRDGELARLRASLAETQEHLHRVEAELEALKRIDLQRHR